MHWGLAGRHDRYHVHCWLTSGSFAVHWNVAWCPILFLAATHSCNQCTWCCNCLKTWSSCASPHCIAPTWLCRWWGYWPTHFWGYVIGHLLLPFKHNGPICLILANGCWLGDLWVHQIPHEWHHISNVLQVLCKTLAKCFHSPCQLIAFVAFMEDLEDVAPSSVMCPLKMMEVLAIAVWPPFPPHLHPWPWPCAPTSISCVSCWVWCTWTAGRGGHLGHLLQVLWHLKKSTFMSAFKEESWIIFSLESWIPIL